MAPAEAYRIDERDGPAQFEAERTGKRASFAEIAREPRDGATARNKIRVELNQVGSDTAGNRIYCFANRLEIGRLAQGGAQVLVLRVVAAEVPDLPGINIGRARPSFYIPNNNVVAAQSKMPLSVTAEVGDRRRSANQRGQIAPGQTALSRWVSRYEANARAQVTISARPSSSPVRGFQSSSVRTCAISATEPKTSLGEPASSTI
jgi:hypothetical protein